MELIDIISKNVEWWIHKRGYPTLERFSLENGFAKPTISRLIKKVHMPKADLIVKIAKALEVTPDTLVLEPKTKPKGWGTKIFIGGRSN